METSPLYWIEQTLAVLPAILWVYAGVGLPWALTLLPRRDWQDRALTAVLALVAGPALLTAWMLFLGTLGAAWDQPLLQAGPVLAGTVGLALAGWGLWFYRLRREAAPPRPARVPLAADEKLLIGLIGIALVLRWLTTAYWPFTAYDALWVYGYEGRLYFLLGFIPQEIGYYPQFLPLQYTYAQLMAGGISDHAARAWIPFTHLAGILAVYVLAARLFTRRAGFFAAAIWALYPHVGDWAHIGDLEIPLTMLFTLASAFFLLAWTQEETRIRRHYALLAGLVFGVAMWTKPTAGAFALGVALLVAVELLRTRLDWRQWRPRFEVAALTGLASIPLGTVWYLRNGLLGHNLIDMPHPFWLTQARRSGDHFGWLLLALFVLLAFLYLGRRGRPDPRGILAGLTLVLAGTLPSMPLLNPARFDPPLSRMMLPEWAALLAGAALLAFALWHYARPRWTETGRRMAGVLAWGLLLSLPYFATWFYSYSYHYRLGFPVVPLLLLPTAVLLAHWLPAEKPARWRPPARLLWLALIAAISLPGVLSTLVDGKGQIGWLWTDQYPDDTARYIATNPAVTTTALALQAYIDTHDQPPLVVAPAEQRLRFFFPLLDIRTDSAPSRLDELVGATHYLYTSFARSAYIEAGIPPQQNQIVGALARQDIMEPVSAHADGTFTYELYELHPDRRFDYNREDQFQIGRIFADDILFGGYIRLVGADFSYDVFVPGERVFMNLLWKVLETPPQEYTFFVHLVYEDDETPHYNWDGHIAPGRHGYYAATVWQPGEFIFDQRVLRMERGHDVTPAQGYRIRIGLYAMDGGERLPLHINGQPAGDGYILPVNFTVR